MRPLAHTDLADLASYAGLRPTYRRAVIAHKKTRRMAVGDRVTLMFEDRETLRFQVQEMLLVERIDDPARVQNELDVYNELMPRDRELSATLFIEITDLADIRPELNRMIGLDEHVSLELGSGDAAERIRAGFDPKQLEEDRLSAVQYIRFRLDEPQAARFEDRSVPAAVRVDHPAYSVSAPIPPEVRASLVTGLRGEPPALLTPPPPATREELLFESGRVRAVRRSKAPEHVVVEARDATLVDPALIGELLAAVQRVAEDVAERHGRARVQADWTREAAALRWHVVARGKSR